MHLLIPELRTRAEGLCREHTPLLREEHFDEGVIAVLNRLGATDGVKVLDELGNNSLVGVRNLPAYIMGICKRHGSGGGGGQFGGRGGGRGGRAGGRSFRVPDFS